MGRGGALALACALAFVADVEAKVGARRGGGYSIVNTGQGGDLDTATTVVILCFVGLAVIFCAFGALGARRLTRYRARYDASRALEELDLGTLTPGTKVTLRHNGVDIDGVGTVLGSSEPHGDRVQIEWPPSTPSHFTYRPDGPRGRKMRVERKTWWPRASVVPYTEPPEDTIECEAPARDPPRETTPTTHETLIDGKVMAGAWLCEWRDDDARPEIFDRYKKNNAAAKVTSFGAMLALETDGDCEDGRVRLRSNSRERRCGSTHSFKALRRECLRVGVNGVGPRRRRDVHWTLQAERVLQRTRADGDGARGRPVAGDVRVGRRVARYGWDWWLDANVSGEPRLVGDPVVRVDGVPASGSTR